MFPQHTARLVALVIAGVLAPLAGAQPDSPSSMRQRIAELETQVAALRAELGAISAERDALRSEVERLRAAVAPGGAPASRPAGSAPSGGAPQSVPVSALSQDPLSSPDAMFVALLLDYRDRFMGDPTVTAPPEPEAVSDWSREMRSEMSGATTWLVMIDEVVRAHAGDGPDEGLRAVATVLDSGTGLPISRPVAIDIPRRMEGRFPETVERGEPVYAELRVKVDAAPVFQPRRETAGPFDFPPFIGPYAGFGYNLEIAGLRFVEDTEIRALREKPRGPVNR